MLRVELTAVLVDALGKLAEGVGGPDDYKSWTLTPLQLSGSFEGAVHAYFESVGRGGASDYADFILDAKGQILSKGAPAT